MRKLAIVFIALCILPLHTMEHDPSNHNEQSLDTAVKVLAVTGNFYSLLESVAKNLKERDALKVSTLKRMIDAADSRLESGAIFALEKVIGFSPPFVIPYLERVAGTFDVRGPGFIQFLVGQKKEQKSLSDLLQTVRHGARYLAPNQKSRNHFLSRYEETINNGLNDYYPLLPALGAGIRAMHASLISNEVDVFYDAQQEPDDFGSLIELEDAIKAQKDYESGYLEYTPPTADNGMTYWLK